MADFNNSDVKGAQPGVNNQYYGAPPSGNYPTQQYPGAPNYSGPQGQYVPAQQAVVVQTAAPIERAEPYLVWSIVNCLFCCCCMGIAAIVISSNVMSANGRGDIDTARRQSLTARNLNIATTIVGVLVIIIAVVLNVTGVVSTTTYYY